MANEFSDETLLNRWEQFFSEWDYIPRIHSLADTYPDTRSLEVSYWDLSRFDAELAESILEDPERSFALAEQAVMNQMPPDTQVPLHFRLRDLPTKVHKIEIRNLRARHLVKYIAIEGLVRKATEVRPKMTEAVFECLRCGALQRVAQDEFFFKEPLECPKETGCGRAAGSTAFRLLPRLSTFIDTQRVEIQESPEGLRGGEQPQRLMVNLDDDLTGIIQPGDRLTLNGVLKSKQRGIGPKRRTIFDIYLECGSIEIQEHDFEEVDISPEDIDEILTTSRDPTIFINIRKSVAPSIFGMTMEKEALVLQMFGGVMKSLPDGTRIRGDIHVFLIGDPGTAKSQLLRHMSEIAPRGIYASGQAATKAGLTASAIRDEFADGRWTLEAGALVLADKGIACIDELDKMSDQDRSSMHEALEQQRISIAKAGITATLQSRCALLGAANPKFGRFVEYQPIAEQIDLPPALLSRFDVIFPIIDKPDHQADYKMADHILSVHRAGEIHEFRRLNAEGRYSEEDEKSAFSESKPIYEADFLRKYVAYSKRTCFPVLTERAFDELRKYYVNIRRQGEGERAPVPITARQLEALVRLAEASARVKLKEAVETEDTDRAINIMKYYLSKVAREDGIMDIDLIASGTSHSQRERFQIVIGIIRELQAGEQYGADCDDIIGEAQRHGIDRQRTETLLQRLEQEGRIFSPRARKYKVT